MTDPTRKIIRKLLSEGQGVFQKIGDGSISAPPPGCSDRMYPRDLFERLLTEQVQLVRAAHVVYEDGAYGRVEAVEDGQTVGRQPWTLVKSEIQLGLSVVEPAYRRKGIGKAMLRHVVDEIAPEVGADRIMAEALSRSGVLSIISVLGPPDDIRDAQDRPVSFDPETLPEFADEAESVQYWLRWKL